jgi:hypothetical protein
MNIKDKYKVTSIDSYLTHEWLLYKHYAKRIPSIMYSFGLYEQNILKGVCTFGMPPSSTLPESICGEKYKQYVLELNRLVISEVEDKNVLSYFVSNSINFLPNPSIIVSFSDENMGHFGYIYQACNFIYTGKTTNDSKLIDQEGKEFHFRNIGHYQKNNKLKVSLHKVRINEEQIDKIAIADYIKNNLNGKKIKELDLLFGYKDTCSHWVRKDKGFSFPSVNDWIKLKEILSFDNTYDEIMTNYRLLPDSSEIIKKLNLTKVDILPKHRYIYLKSKNKKELINNFKLKILPYPKGENKRYDASYEPIKQILLF